jgi:hypothetical protein
MFMKVSAILMSLVCVDQEVYAMQILKAVSRLGSQRERLERAKNTMEICAADFSNERLDKCSREFTRDRQHVHIWFDKHKIAFNNFLKEFEPGFVDDGDVELRVMGSYKWGTNHTLSDLDCVLVSDGQDKEGLFGSLINFYHESYPDLETSQLVTKAGLPLFIMHNFNDPELGEIKLEYTLQTSQVNNRIISNVEGLMEKKFKNNMVKALYALAVMDAELQDDQNALSCIKGWLSILKEKEDDEGL